MTDCLTSDTASALVAAPAVRCSALWGRLAAAGLLGAAVLLSACGGSSSGSSAGPAETSLSAGSAETGQRLYSAAGANCIQCHTNAATMQRTSDEVALAGLIGTAIAQDKGRMGDPSLNLQSLDAQAMRDIAAFILAQPAPSSPAAPPGSPSLPAGVTAIGALPPGYVRCASQGQGSCTFSGTVNLVYGANGAFRQKAITGPSFDCATGDSVFGDPVAGVGKNCYGPSGQVNNADSTGSSGTVVVRTADFVTGLSSPWGMAWLPDGRLLVTQKSGSMVLISANGSSRTTLSWGSPQPSIRDGGQGGLLGIAVDPDFATTPWIYFSYQEPGPNSTSGTAVGRAQLQGNALTGFQRLLQQTPKVGQDGVHFGSRLAFRTDETLLVSFGDRGQDDPGNPGTGNAQNLAKSLGKLMRINRDGSIPSDNPATPTGSVPGLWSWGHRNPQGLTVDPATGNVWETEHGPQGGDELNLVQPGTNYGWPLRSYGCPYGSTPGNACQVNGGVHSPLNGVSFTEPVTFWVPTSVAPSNVIVYRGSRFPEWTGNLLMGSMADPALWRVVVSGGMLVSRERIVTGQGRVRDVSQGPDGWIYLAIDDGRIVRVTR